VALLICCVHNFELKELVCTFNDPTKFFEFPWLFHGDKTNFETVCDENKYEKNMDNPFPKTCWILPITITGHAVPDLYDITAFNGISTNTGGFASFQYMSGHESTKEVSNDSSAYCPVRNNLVFSISRAKIYAMKANTYGGSLYITVDDVKFKFSDISVYNSSALKSGGAIYLNGISLLNFNRIKFDLCNSSESGE
jgi:predicted outer membrane repeat protein